MGNPVVHSKYTAEQISAAVGKSPVIRGGYWYIWDIAGMEYVTTGVAAESATYAAQAAASAASAAASASTAAQEAASQAASQTAGALRSEMQGYTAAAENSAEDAEAWAVGQRGGTDVPDTDETHHNNAEYWAGVAMAQADRAVAGPVEGVYSTIVSDRVTGVKYSLVVVNGRLTLLQVSANADTANLQLVDVSTGAVYTLTAESGRVILEEV